MTEFENHLKAIFEAYNGAQIDPKLAAELHTPALLALAKKAFEKAEMTEQNLTSAATEAHIRLEESGELSFLEIFRAGAEWAMKSNN